MYHKATHKNLINSNSSFHVTKKTNILFTFEWYNKNQLVTVLSFLGIYCEDNTMLLC